MTGRYLTPDPIGLAGGINPFVYSLNNPINHTDRYGLFLDDTVSPAIIGAIGAGIIATYEASKSAIGWLADNWSKGNDDENFSNAASGGSCPNGDDDDPDDDSPGDYKFPSEKQLAKEFGIKRNQIHNLKDQLKSDFSSELKKLNAHNPDIGISRNGNIVFKSRMTGNTINTKVPVRYYRP